MRKSAKVLSILGMCVLFGSMQMQANAMMYGDTGLGVGNGGAVINSATGGYTGTDLGTNSATLNFNGNACVNWDSLNLNSNETLNFNAADGVNGISVLNTVNGNVSNLYGAINANSGISNLIISNPNGILFDGAHVTAAGDVMVTTQALGAEFNGANMTIKGLPTEAFNAVTIKDSNFSVGGEFNITAPTINVLAGAIQAGKGVKFITADGQNFLVAPTTNANFDHQAVKLQSVNIDGDVYIASSHDIVTLIGGGEIKGNLNIESDGNVAVNYVANGNRLHVTGDITSNSDGRIAIIRNSDVDGNIKMSNSGGYVEIANITAGKDVDLSTTVETNKSIKHFIHVVGDNDIKGNLKVDSAHNIHIGGYDTDLTDTHDGSLKVGGNIDATAREGNIAVTIDTTANKIALTSETLNIISDDKAVIKANEYQFKANGYIGGLDDHQKIINSMEGYTLIPPETKTFLNIDGGEITKLETADNGYAFVRSNNDMVVTGMNANKVNLSSAKDIKILGNNIHADTVLVDGETKNLTVETPSYSRDYTLTYTDIRDNAKITIGKDVEITYDMTNGTNGLNINEEGRPDNTTYLVVEPGPGPEPQPIPEEPEKYLTEIVNPVDLVEVYTPVAFAADLDDEIVANVRKNVDGSVTVVKAFVPSAKAE